MNELSDDRSSGYRSSPSLHSEETAPSSPESGDIFGSAEDVYNSLQLSTLKTRFSLESQVGACALTFTVMIVRFRKAIYISYTQNRNIL